MEVKENKIEFDLEELAPLLIANKTEGFRQIGEEEGEKKGKIRRNVQVIMITHFLLIFTTPFTAGCDMPNT